MKVLSSIFDRRIKSKNLYVDTTFGEYLSYAREIITNNELQRKRVRTSKTVYSLLQKDLIQGCIMPAIVIALIDTKGLANDSDDDALQNFLEQNTSNVIILDGLQRTYTLIDAEQQLKETAPDGLVEFYNNKLRLEIYQNINKFGVLYRMLTLNTGQTPMSTRHQLEILYNNMAGTQVDGITLIREVDGAVTTQEDQFSFKNTIEGFHSYMTRNEQPIDRLDLLESIKMLEKMAKEDIRKDLYQEFLTSYVCLFNVLKNMNPEVDLGEDSLATYGIMGAPFGRNVAKVFSTSQAMTGFGSAVGFMIDKQIISSFADLEKPIADIKSLKQNSEWFMELLASMDKIRNQAKKIGSAQRLFFQYFFRELLNPESDSYKNIYDAVQSGYHKYDSQG